MTSTIRSMRLRPHTGATRLSLLASLSWLLLAHLPTTLASEYDTIPQGLRNGERIRAIIDEVDWGGPVGVDVGVEGVAMPDSDIVHEDAAHPQYESTFANVGLDESMLGKRQQGFTNLPNNAPERLNISPGGIVHYVVQNSTVWGPSGDPGEGLPSPIQRRRDDDHDDDPAHAELRKRQAATKTVWLSMNTCQQPTSNETVSAPPPQLTMYISTSDDNQKPGPNVTDSQRVVALLEGYASIAVQAEKNIYVSVFAPSLPSSYSGVWNYKIAASVDAPFFEANNNSFLGVVDTDTTSALLITGNLTEEGSSRELRDKWLKGDTRFTIFAYAEDNAKVQGLTNSFCGLELAQKDALTVTTSMTDRDEDDLPRQQFHVQGLTGSTKYRGLLAMSGNSTASGPGVVGGGGRLWRPMTFTTKSDGNCALIFSLPFCDSIAYAAPSNPNLFPNHAVLATHYDTRAQELYKNFNRSLQQIPCNTTDTAQYSLARTCDDCARDYKDWLCAVTIPRCTDFSDGAPADSPSIRPRNIASPFYNGSGPPDLERLGWDANWLTRRFANSSRNAWIDETIQPGPYKEVMPCSETCWDVVRSCPAALQFRCPESGIALQWGYGQEPDCNRVGVYNVDGSRNVGRRLSAGTEWSWALVGVYLLVWFRF